MMELKIFDRTHRKDIFNRELWTESEKRLDVWLSRFGEFHGIRM